MSIAEVTMTHRPPVPHELASQPIDPAHTLAGVLSRLRRNERGAPDLEQRLNAAFAKHAEKLHGYCRRELRGHSAEVVEEVVHDVLLEAWNKLPTYRAESRFRAFLWGIAAFKCANYRRKRRDLLSADGLIDDVDTGRTALQMLSDEARNRLVEEAARNVLDEKDQEIVYLRWVLDYPYDDIVSLLGLSGTAEIRAALARSKRRMATEIGRLLAELGHGDSFLRPA
jgi:RNA polymerase sigma-70 factor (ECF subfamily)